MGWTAIHTKYADITPSTYLRAHAHAPLTIQTYKCRALVPGCTARQVQVHPSSQTNTYLEVHAC